MSQFKPPPNTRLPPRSSYWVLCTSFLMTQRGGPLTSQLILCTTYLPQTGAPFTQHGWGNHMRINFHALEIITLIRSIWPGAALPFPSVFIAPPFLFKKALKTSSPSPRCQCHPCCAQWGQHNLSRGSQLTVELGVKGSRYTTPRPSRLRKNFLLLP